MIVIDVIVHIVVMGVLAFVGAGIAAAYLALVFGVAHLFMVIVLKREGLVDEDGYIKVLPESRMRAYRQLSSLIDRLRGQPISGDGTYLQFCRRCKQPILVGRELQSSPSVLCCDCCGPLEVADGEKYLYSGS